MKKQNYKYMYKMYDSLNRTKCIWMRTNLSYKINDIIDVPSYGILRVSCKSVYSPVGIWIDKDENGDVQQVGM